MESGDVTDQQGDAQEALIISDTAREQRSENEDSASDSDSDSDECAAAESEEDIVDEIVQPSQMKHRTRNKSRRVALPEPLTCSDSEDELPRLQSRKRNYASPAALRADGYAKYFRRNSNQFPKSRILLE